MFTDSKNNSYHGDEQRAAFVDRLSAESVFSWRRLAVIALIVTLLSSFVVWAGVSEIDQHVRASGQVVPAGKTRTVQHLEGGIITNILVNEGDKVQAGDVIFHIANTRVRTSLEETKIQQQAMMIRRERLIAELGQKNLLRFSSSLDNANASLLDAERELFSLRRKEHQERLLGYAKRRQQKVLEIEALQSQIKNMDDELAVLSRQVEIQQGLYQSGVVSEAHYLQVKSSLLGKQADRQARQMQIPVVAAERDEADSQISELSRTFASQARTELNEVEVALDTVKERIAALTDEVERSDIVSPIDGRVNKLYVHTHGGVSQPGAPLAEITPERETLVVEGTISTKDRGKVWPELPVVTHVSAYDYAIYGGLSGELSYISPDTFQTDNASPYYKVRVRLDSDRFDDERIVRPGMSAEVNILTGRVTVLSALLKPLTKLRSNALKES